MGRILVRGQPGHDLIPELKALPGEIVIDKPGKGAFYATDLQARLESLGVHQLVVTGVTTEVCVQTTVREANDRGYDCLLLSDCTASYFPEFHAATLQDGAPPRAASRLGVVFRTLAQNPGFPMTPPPPFRRSGPVCGCPATGMPCSASGRTSS